MSEIVRPPLKHPRGHCWQTLTHNDDPKTTIARLETTRQCREWLAKMNEMDASAELKRAVSQRYQELES